MMKSDINTILDCYLHALRSDLDNGTPRFKTGFVELDQLGGFAKGLNIIGARPFVGAHSFTASMITNLASVGSRVAVLRYWQNDNKWENYIASNVLQIQGIDLSKNTNTAWNKLDHLYSENLCANYILLQSFLSWADLDRTAFDLVRTDHIQYLFVDGLQDIHIDGSLMSDMEWRPDSAMVETNIICERLKKLSANLDIPIIVLSQLNREPDIQGREPQLFDLRNCDAEQYAENIYLLSRPTDYPNQPETLTIQVSVHNSMGPSEKICLSFDPKNHRVYSEKTTTLFYHSNHTAL